MLLQENLVYIFRIHVELQSILGLTNFMFSSDKNGLCALVPCPPEKNRWMKKKLVLLLIFTLVIWIQLIQGRRRFPLVVVFESLIYCVLSTVFTVVRWVYIQEQDTTIEFFRLIFQFERKHLSGN